MSDQEDAPLSRHLVAFVTFLVLLPLVYFVPPWVSKNITSDRLAVTVIAVAIIVPIITYFALPGFFWLHKRFKRGGK